jgi:hypothetical protein
MAFILGLAQPEEISEIRAAGYEATEVSQAKEIEFFGMDRPDRSSGMIMVYVDCGIKDLLELIYDN